MTIIVSNYAGSYESIHTEEALCILHIKLRYLLKGYKPWPNMPLWFAILYNKYTGKTGFYRTANVFFEKHIPGSDQITYWQPWMNVN
jgi:hypothetical protein